MKKGFTIVELCVTIAVMAILMSIGTLTLSNLQHRYYIDTAVEAMISDIKNQQVLAMTGDTGGSGATKRYGIYFQLNQYVLFDGNTYSSTSPTNLVITLRNSLQLTNIMFPSSILQFEKGSGEAIGVGSTANRVTIRNTVTGQQKTVNVNMYGVVTAVN